MNKIIICGLGSIGIKHFQIIKDNFPDIRIGLYRSGKGKPNEEISSSDYLFKSFEEVMNWEPEAAIISSPATEHFKNSQPFIKENIPLLIEKPIDSDFNNLEKWRDIKRTFINKKILVGYVLMYDPAVNKIKKLLDTKAIGKIINIEMKNSSWLPNWRPKMNYKKTVSASKELGGGILLEQSHDFNIALNLFGELLLKKAYVTNSGLLDIDVEDTADIYFLNKKKVPINIHMDFCSKNENRENSN